MDGRSNAETKWLAQFLGAMLGTMVGDQLGAALEGAPVALAAERMRSIESATRRMSPRYTDDTEMMIGGAEELDAFGELAPESLAKRLAVNMNVMRGYGGGVTELLAGVRGGRPLEEMLRLVFPDGSFASR